MRTKLFLLSAGVIAVAGCAVRVAVPELASTHPANPAAAAAPMTPASPTLQSENTRTAPADDQFPDGTDHDAMAGMDHSPMDHGAMPGMDHGSMQGMSNGRHGAQHVDEHGPSAAGQPGEESQVDRTVEVTAYDTMSYKPQSLGVKPGETIRFVVTNAGKIRHEFVIATAGEQQEHDQMMQQMPNMMHQDPNAVTLEPGETKTLIWQFGGGGVVQYACHVLGHYQTGMIGKVFVGTADAPSEDHTNTDMGAVPDMGEDMKDMEGMKGMEGMQDGH